MPFGECATDEFNFFGPDEELAETHLASRAVIGEPENRRSDSPP